MKFPDININVDSWHYKIINKDMEPEQNLCGYFWQLILSILVHIFSFWITVIFPIIFVATTTFMYFLGFLGFLETPYGFELRLQEYFSPDLISVSMAVCVVITGMILVSLLFATIIFLENKKNIKHLKERGNKTFKLVSAFIQAKKKKICPRINFIVK